ncbi:hypothetical protein [Emticicia sp. BO119]|uniref:hypothetical protein n=1 Tax=Emticicia sp. BO119 TaxID=2757768 RepID=UPI0015F1240F|nr:hypothetical protein [Emticicia sp. BO119]MBA4849046.1 hypothetical protein [Emticicia sp. BO119]
MKNTTKPKGSFILIPIRNTPQTAKTIATQLIPKWSGEAAFIIPSVKGKSLKETCRNLYSYCRKEFAYHVDPKGKELIRSPYQSWSDRKNGIDCEDYAIIIASTLLELGYSSTLRIVDYGNGWQHIYVLVQGIVIDPVSSLFNYQESYNRKLDFVVETTKGLSGYKAFKSIGKSINASKLAYEKKLGKEALKMRTAQQMYATHGHQGVRDFFVAKMQEKIAAKVKLNKTAIEKIAQYQYNIEDPREVKELTELAIVKVVRSIAHHPNKSVRGIYEKLVELYQSQVNLSLRTSTSVLLQQYSTPSPIAYLMGVYCGIHLNHPDEKYLEPSAGNGLLTVAGKPKQFYVNEIDDLRANNLEKQGYAQVTRLDSSSTNFRKGVTTRFDAVITNPPFAALDKKDWVTFDGYEIKDLDHLMAIRALELMKSDGKAAIIIGGHTSWDELGRIQKGKNRLFINYLYSHYQVDDIILIDGDLYSRMGTSFNIRLILINGRKEKPEGVAPLRNFAQAEVVGSFDELYERIMLNVRAFDLSHKESLAESEARAHRIRILKLKYSYETNPPKTHH